MLILASASPRRLELLERLTREFRVVPADVDETLAGGPTPEAVAALALRKARTVAVRLEQGVVLGADTVVVIDGAVLGKPADAAEARTMLYRLRGRRHEVITGLAVVDAAGGRSATDAVVTEVVMRGYDDATIDSYVASGEPLDKAGAYAIHGRAGAWVTRITGSYSGIMGLPLAETAELLQKFNIPVW